LQAEPVNLVNINQCILDLNVGRWEQALDNDIGYQHVEEDELLPVSDDFLPDQLKLAEEQNRLKSMAPGEAKLIRQTKRLASLGACTCKHKGAGLHKDVCPKSYISKGIALAQLKREEKNMQCFLKLRRLLPRRLLRAAANKGKQLGSLERRPTNLFVCQVCFCICFLILQTVQRS
jgi:hypothetical protein